MQWCDSGQFTLCWAKSLSREQPTYLPHELVEKAHAGDFQTVEACLKAGLSPNATCEIRHHGRNPSVPPTIAKGATLLQLCAIHGCKHIARLLLQSQADPNHRDTVGFTALHTCARTGRLEIASLLLSAKANVFQLDNSETDALTAAQQSKNHAVAKLLRKHMAVELRAGAKPQKPLLPDRAEERSPPLQGSVDQEAAAARGAAASEPGTLLAGVTVRVHGLQGRPELNGLSGRVIRYDAAAERYEVWVEGMGEGEGVRLRPANLTEGDGQSPSKVSALPPTPPTPTPTPSPSKRLDGALVTDIDAGTDGDDDDDTFYDALESLDTASVSTLPPVPATTRAKLPACVSDTVSSHQGDGVYESAVSRVTELERRVKLAEERAARHAKEKDKSDSRRERAAGSLNALEHTKAELCRAKEDLEGLRLKGLDERWVKG